MRTIQILLLSLCLMGISQNASAKGAVVYHNGPKGSIIEKLPEDLNIDGTHINLGVVYEQFGLFWLPVWNYGEPRYALLSDDENTYWDLDDETLQNIKEEYSLDIPETPGIPLWQKIGLKPVILILLIFFILGRFSKK